MATPTFITRFLLYPMGLASSFLSLLTPPNIPEDKAVWPAGGGLWYQMELVQNPGPPLTSRVT